MGNDSEMVAQLYPLHELRDGTAGQQLRRALRAGGLSNRQIAAIQDEYANADCVLLNHKNTDIGLRLVAIGLSLADWPLGPHDLFRSTFSSRSYVVVRIVQAGAPAPSPPAYALTLDVLSERARKMRCDELGVWAPAREVRMEYRQSALQGTLITRGFFQASAKLPIAIHEKLIPHAAWKKKLGTSSATSSIRVVSS